MEEEQLKKWLLAGSIAKRALKLGAKLIEPGVKVLDVCEKVESMIIEQGGKPAFPCNLSINEEAAHYSPKIGDDKVIPEGAVVKLDIGAHVDGYLSDTAVTVVLDEKYSKLAEASREALNAAIRTVKPGVAISDVGKAIERTIKSYGFRPIRNLGGHMLKRYELHAGVFVPNVGERVMGRFAKDQVFAIEPFSTDGFGEVVEGKDVTIYSLRNPNAKMLTDVEKKVLSAVQERFSTLPFSERWLKDVAPPEELRSILHSLVKKGALRDYPVLVEVKKGIVSQFEHTIIVLDGEVVVTTGEVVVK
ncbi:MAG: type II methionyl aminopeptidase [Thermoprotei archaeon]